MIYFASVHTHLLYGIEKDANANLNHLSKVNKIL